MFKRAGINRKCLLLIQRIKEALRSFGQEIQTQNFNIYDINEVVIQTHYLSMFFPII